MRLMFFAINFGVAELFVVACMMCIMLPFYGSGTLFSFLGGLFFLVPCGVFAFLEWLAYFHRRRTLEFGLGIVCLAIGGFAVFGVVVTVAEALQTSWPEDFEWAVVIGSAIAAYFTACGTYRLWSGRASKFDRSHQSMNRGIGKISIAGVAVIALPAMVMMVFLPRFAPHATKIDVVGGDACPYVPSTARNIYAKGSCFDFAAEFEITEADFVRYCRSQKWDLQEITSPVNLQTYRAFDQPQQAPAEVSIARGLIYDGMSGGCWYRVAFDRDTGRGFMEFAVH